MAEAAENRVRAHIFLCMLSYYVLWHMMCIWFSVKMTARLDVNATPGGRMSPIAPGIVPECSGASRVKRAARARPVPKLGPFEIDHKSAA